MASQSACSRMRQLKTSGAPAAMASAASARCVGVQTFGGASTIYLYHVSGLCQLPKSTVQPSLSIHKCQHQAI